MFRKLKGRLRGTQGKKRVAEESAPPARAEALEKRVLFSADLPWVSFDDAGLEVFEQVERVAQDSELDVSAAEELAEAAPPVLIIDRSYGDAQQVDAATLESRYSVDGLETFMLNEQADGIDAVSEMLEARVHGAGVTIATTASAEGIRFGSSTLSVSSVLNRIGDVSEWRGHLGSDSYLRFFAQDMELYGEREHFAELLSDATGTPVECSSLGGVSELDDCVADLADTPRAISSSLAEEPEAVACDPGADAANDSEPEAVSCETEMAAAEISREIVFIDPRIDDYRSLLNDIQANDDPNRQFDVILLDGSADGLAQIEAVLAQYGDVDAVHILSHSSPGSLQIGSTWLTTDTVDGYAAALGAWSDSLADGADLLFYGCDLAGDAGGIELLEKIQEYSGADVAASSDKTGHELLDADWQFEYTAGEIETEIAISEQHRAAYMYTLDIDTDLVLHLAFDEGSGFSAEDSAGGDNDGNLLNSPSWTSDAVVGDFALDFTGDATNSNAYVEVADSANLDFSGDFSVSFWYNADAVPSGQVRLVGSHDGATGFSVYADSSGDLNFFLEGSTAVSSVTESGKFLNDGEWHHVTAVRVGDDIRIFVDGVNTTVNNQAVGSVDPSAPVHIGSDYSNFSDYEGLLDDVRIYTRALAASDVDELYATANRGQPDGYLAAWADNNASEWITNVNFAGIENTTGQETGGYGNYSNLIGSVTVGETNTLSVTINPDSNDYLTAWIDWNQDGDFTDPGEEYVIASAVATSGPHTIDITAPAYATVGNTVMRVGLNWSAAPDSYGQHDYGEFEDYTISVNSADTPTIDLDADDSVAAGQDFATTWTQGSGAVSIVDSDAVLSDADSTNLESLTVTITNLRDGVEEILAADTTGTSITASYDSATGTLTMSGTDSVANYQQVLRSITYDNTHWAAYGESRVIEFVASDGVNDSTAATTTVSMTTDYNVVMVTNSSDTVGGDTSSIDALIADDGGDGISLREAMLAANNTTNTANGPDVIRFDVSGAGPHTITLSSALPTITSPVVIDATTEPDYGGSPVVVIDGNGTVGDGFVLGSGADGSRISGFVIRDFTSNAIQIDAGSDGNIITGNYLGSLNADGSDAGSGEAIGAAAIFVQGANNIIGGNTDIERNVIAGAANGVVISGASATGNVVSGNYIGTDATGNTVIGTTFDGVRIDGGASGNTVGGATAAHGNVITGNGAQGVQIDGSASSGNTIQYNAVGVIADGSAAPGNNSSGIYISGSADSTNILNNHVAGSLYAGIEIDGTSSGSVIQGNIIGTDSTGMLNWGNGENGILLENGASNTTIGGTVAGEGNIIAFNGRNSSVFNSGVLVESGVTGVSIRGNSIYGNVGIGVDLSATTQSDGLTSNDAGDADNGGNNLQNWAVINSAAIDSGGTFSYDIDTTTLAAGSYTVDFYVSSDREGGSVEGERYIGTASGVANGNASLTGTLSGVTLNEGEYVTLLVTDSSGNTSEFSSYAVATSSEVGGSAPTDLAVSSTANGGLAINSDGGNDSYLVADDGGAILGGLGSVTFELQFSTTDTSSFTPLVSYASPTNENEFVFVISGSDAYLYIADTDIHLTGFDYNSLRDGSQQSLAVTWDNTSGDWAVYNDGVLIDSGTGVEVGNTLDAGGTLIFGQEQDVQDAGFDASQTFQGTLYNARFFSDVRSSAELAATFESELGYDEADMLAQWTFDALTPDGVTTETVAGNNLTLRHTAGTGFTASSPSLTLSLSESAADGTVVGSVAGADPEREALIASILASDPTLSYSAETGKFYQAVSTVTTWTTAQSNATSSTLQGVSGQLVTIRSAFENQFVNDIQNSSAIAGSQMWLGAGDFGVEGEWRWYEGSTAGDQFWSGDELGGAVNGEYHNWKSATAPNDNGSGEDAAYMLADGTWEDNRDNVNFAYMIEWDAEEVLNASQALSYSIESQTVAGAFAVDAATGQISVADGTLLDYETDAIHSLTVRVTDVDGNTYDEVFAVSLANVVGEPAVTVPIAQTTGEDTTLTFSAAGGNAVAVTNDDAGDGYLSVTLSVDHGTLVLAQTTGITFVDGGQGNAGMTIYGLESDLNAALDGLTYTPNSDYSGNDTLSISTEVGGLEGLYTFEGGSPGDASAGTAYDGSFVGNATTVTDGERGEVLSLDGSGDYIQINGEFGQPASITTSAWINASAAYGEVISIAGVFDIRVDDPNVGNNLTGFYYDGTSYNHATSDVQVAGTGWHHVALSFDDATKTLTLYLDGQVAATETFTGSIAYSGGDSFIGVNNGGGLEFNGLIDDARVYTRALTADEIATIAAESFADASDVAISVDAINDAPTYEAGDGVVSTDRAGLDNSDSSVYVQGDGRILTVGSEWGSNWDIALSRYNDDGSVDTSFGGGDGLVSFDFAGASDTAVEMTVQPDGKILLAGRSGGDVLLMRLNADGSVDTGFGGGDGVAIVDTGSSAETLSDIVLQADGKIVVAGTADNGGIDDALVMRFNADGTLDSTFGGGAGYVRTTVGTDDVNVSSVALQSDGSILIGGRTYDGANYLSAILRYTNDGTLDSTYGGGDGIATFDATSGIESLSTLLVQDDGKVIATGWGYDPSASVVLARLNTDGSLDTGFGGGDGLVVTSIGSGGSAVQLDDGRIAVSGGVTGSATDFAVFMYLSDGTLDTSFGGGDGYVSADVRGGHDYAADLFVQADGKLVVVGDAWNAAYNEMDAGIVRFTADGSIDTRFSLASTLDGNPGFTEGGAAVVLDADVEIYDDELTAADDFGGASLTLVRNGGANADDVFSASGNLVFNGGALELSSVAIGTVTNTGGQLVLTFSAGVTNAQVNEAMRSIAYANDSDTPPASVQIDWTFDDGNLADAQGSGGAQQAIGSTTVNIAATNDAPTGTVTIDNTAPNEGDTLTASNTIVDPDGISGPISYQWYRDGVAIAGATASSYRTTEADSGSAISVVALYTDDYGSNESVSSASTAAVQSVNFAPTFDIGGFAVYHEGEDGYGQNAASIVLADGSTLLTPYDSSFGSALLKFNPDGTIDTSFGASGLATGTNLDYIEGIAVQDDGKILVAGSSGSSFAVARYNADGTQDTSFGVNGIATTELSGSSEGATDIVVQADGKIVVVGDGGTDSVAIRYNADGSLDTSFGTSGVATFNLGGSFEEFSAVALQTDGKIVIGGESHVLRLNADGSLDTGFDSDGIAMPGHTVLDIVVQADGQIVATGGNGTNLVVSRYDTNGALDAGFGTGGTVTWTDARIVEAAGHSIVQQSDGKLVMAGNAETGDWTTEWAVVRFNTDGTVDTGFADDGAWVMAQSDDFNEVYSLSLYDDGIEEKIVAGGYTNLFGARSSAIVSFHADGSLDYSRGSENTLDGNPSFTEGGAAVVLDRNVQVYDEDLASADDYGGTILTLSRNGGANPDDIFSATGNLAINGGTLELDSVDIGTVTNSGGQLVFTFATGVTNAQVNEAMQSIAYENSSDAPPASVQIDWSFSDGNAADAQGPGGALIATGSTTVSITGVNDAPVLATAPGGGTHFEGAGTGTYFDSTLTVTDADQTDFDGGTMTVSVTANGEGDDRLLVVDGGNVAVSGSDITYDFGGGPVVVGSFTGGDGANPLVITFNANADATSVTAVGQQVAFRTVSDTPSELQRTLEMTVTDGDGGTSNTASRTMNVVAVNDAPIADHGGPYTINEGDALVLDASASSDAEGDTLTYRWDLDNDGFYDDLVTGSAVSNVSWATLQSLGIDDDGLYTIGLEIDDGNGGVVTSSTSLTVVNLAPTLTASGAATASGENSYTLTLTDTDPGDDTITSWIVNWGDGNIVTYAGDPSSVTHTYSNDLAGLTMNITVSAIDEDGQHFEADMLAPSLFDNQVNVYDGYSGTPDGSFAPAGDGISGHVGLVVGPNGNYFVTGTFSHNVMEYAPDGTLVGEFVTGGSGGLNNPSGLAFGPDGNLYVSSAGSDEVLRYDGTTGDFIDVFVPSTTSGFSNPYGIVFGPDGNLYVGSHGSEGVLKIDADTGAVDGTFSVGSIGDTEDITFGPDGNLYVASFSGGILRFDASTGASLGTFVSIGSGGLLNPNGIEFGPDGSLYVADQNGDAVHRYDGTTGAYIDDYVSGGIDAPQYIAFTPDHQVTVQYTNQAPVVATNTGATVNEGSLGNVITNGMLNEGDPDDSAAGLTYTVTADVTNGTLRLNGTVIGLNDTFTQADIDGGLLTYDHDGSETVGDSFDFSLADGGEDGTTPATGTFAFTVTPVNDAPVADAGGPYGIVEGSGLTLDASASSDVDSGALTYSWDLNNDGTYGDVVGVSPTLSWAELQSFGIDDDGSYTIGVQVDDGNGGITTDSTTLTVNNASPTLTASGALTTAGDNVYTLNLSATDAGDDTITSWTVNWGDGTIETYAGNPSSVTHVYSNESAGLTFNITVSATDEDGQHFEADMLAPAYVGDYVARYDGQDGAVLGTFAPGSDGIGGHANIAIGPNGNYFVTGYDSDNILEYAPDGSFVGTFVAAGAGGLNAAGGLAFGPDGNLYVASSATDEILRYDGATGAFIDVFVPSTTTGLDAPLGLVFSANGDLYVASRGSAGVLKFDGTSGALDTGFSAAAVSSAEDIAIGPDGNVYVAGLNSGVHVFDATTGASLGTFVAVGSGGLTSAAGIEFGPDGHLYVADQNADAIRRYDGSTGAYVDDYAAGSIDGPAYMMFTPDHSVTVENNAAPVIDLDADDSSATGSDYNAAWIEDGGPVLIADSDAVLADADDVNLESMTVTISNLLDGVAEVLTADTTGTSIVANYDSATGVLTLTGSDTAANYQQVLRTVAYDNASDSPDTTSRTIEFVANDGTSDSNVATATVSMADVNDAPSGSVTIDNTTPAQGDTLTASNTITDADGISGPITYHWHRDGVDIAGATGSTYTTTQDDVGAVITVTASYTDDDGYNEEVTSAGTAPVTNVNDAPVIDLDADDSGAAGIDYATTWTEGGGSVFVADADAVLSDVDSGTLDSLTVTITNLWDGAEEGLTADTTGTAITATYDAATGTLTLSGTDTLANYEQVLRTVAYDNTHATPVGGDRIIEFVASDGSDSSAVATTTLDMVTEVGVIVVTNNSDAVNGDTSSIDALLASSGGDGVSLREAILAANNTANTANGPDVIRFDIAGAGPHTVNVSTVLPDITQAVTIDATTDPDYAGTPLVELDFTGSGGDGFLILSDDVTIRGLAINNFTADGIIVMSGTGGVFEDNYIGTDATGMIDRGTGDDGIDIRAGSHTIRNNLISGNDGNGIELYTDGNVVVGNIIGLNASGDAALGNNVGITIDGSNNIIGGSNPADRNVISGNGSQGISIWGASYTGNVVQGNYIGTDVTGSVGIQNGANGIRLVNNVGTSIVGNVISGNMDATAVADGVYITGGSGHVIQSNLIGVAADGTSPLGNYNAGIAVNNATDILIGGDGAGEGNTIAYNPTGVSVTGGAQQVSILGNSIYGNTGLGIDIDGSGVLDNDADDTDGGSNDGQNFPVLESVVSDGITNVAISGSINTSPSSTYRIEFFASSTGDASGHGEGERYLGFVTVTTDASGNASFDAQLSALVADGDAVSAVATEDFGGSSYGDSSEFALNEIAVVDVTPSLDLDANDSAGTGGTDYNAAWTEDGGPVAIVDVDAILTDVDDTDLESLTVTITNLLDGASELLAADTSGTSIVANYDSATGVLTLTGTDSVAAYQQVLRTITYDNSSDSPDTTSRSITFVANDGGNDSNVATTTVSMSAVNDAPAGSVTIDNTTPAQGDVLTASNTITDADGISGPIGYQWYRDGVAIGGATGSTYTTTQTDVGTQISVVASYTDDGGTAESVSSAQTAAVTNVNDPVSGQPVITGTPEEDQTLSADTSGISDADGLGAFSYQWYRDGVAIGGATASTYTLGDGDVGSNVTVTVSYTDGQGTAESTTSNPVGPITNVNDAPAGSVTIDNTTPAQGDVLTASNTITDADGISGPITYQWYRDGVAIGGETASTYTTTQTDVGTQISVVASYTDDQGTAESVSSSQTAAVTNVNDPVSGQPVITGTPEEDQTLTADTSGISDTDGLGAFSYQWYRDGVAVGGATASTYTLGDGDVGSNITVTVSYTDGQGTPESTTSNAVGPVANVNDAPTGTVTIDNTTPAQGDVLTASNTIADADGISGPITYQWQRDGVDIAGATGSSYTTTQSDVGAQISVVAAYTDDQGTAESVSSAQTAAVTNVNDPVSGQPVITGTPEEDQTLSADTSGISDADGLGAFSYQWYRDGIAIGGATASTYTLGDGDVGSNITVTVSYTDGQGTAESTTSNPVGPISNVNDAPAGTVTIDNTTPAEGDTLSASNTLTDADGISGPITYQWQRDGVDIAGATGSSYTTTQSDVGTQISVVAAYADDQGTAESVTSSQTAAVTNVNDPVSGQPVITGTPEEDQMLTADTSGITDTDGLGAFNYQWYRDGVAIGGATASTYSLGDGDVGSNITVTVTYTDGQGTPESTTSNAVGPITNVNDAPTGSVTIDNTTPAQGDVLTASNSIADADGISGPITYQWYRDGVAIGGETASTFTTTQTDVGAQISVTASYTDDQGTAESVSSAQTAAVTNVNDPVSGQPVIVGTPEEDQVLVADTSGISDADGLGAFSYQWYRDGVAIAGATASSYTLADGDVGSNITLTVSYTDGQGTAESTTSNAVGPVTNVNDAVSGQPAIVGTAQEDQLLTADTSSLSDADGLGAFSYQWYRDGVAIGGANASTYTLGDGDVGSNITVAVSYTDGYGTAESAVSTPLGPIANVNDAPAGTVVIDNVAPVEGDVLTASNTITDADGISGPISYQWYRDGVAIGGATGATYATTSADVAAELTVAASYVDDNGSAETVSSTPTAPVTPANVAPTAGDERLAVDEDSGLSIDASRDFQSLVDADGDALTLVAMSQPANGSLQQNGDGSWQYTPNPDFHGTETLDYVVADPSGATASGILTIDVLPVNDAPVGTADPLTLVSEGQTAAGAVSATDVDGDTPRFSITGGSDAERLQIDPVTGVLSFAAAPDYEMPADSDADNVYDIVVAVEDGQGGWQEMPLQVQVGNVNEAPVASDSLYSVNQEGMPAVVGQVVASDPDSGDQLTYEIVGGSGEPYFSVDTTSGDVAATSGVAAGIYDLTVRVVDASGEESMATVKIVVETAEATLGDPVAPPESSSDDADPSSDTTADNGSDAAADPQSETDGPNGELANEPSVTTLPDDFLVDNFELPAEFETTGSILIDGEKREAVLGDQERQTLSTRLRLAFSAPEALEIDFERDDDEEITTRLTGNIVLQLAPELIEAIDVLVEEADEQGFITIKTTGVAVASISLSAGFILWMLRAGSLLASMLATRPVWADVDPLPIFTSGGEKESDLWPGSGKRGLK